MEKIKLKYSGGKKCCVKSCTNKESKRGKSINQPGMKFHRFPTNIKDALLLIPNITPNEFQKYKYKRVCSKHFVRNSELVSKREIVSDISDELFCFHEETENIIYIDNYCEEDGINLNEKTTESYTHRNTQDFTDSDNKDYEHDYAFKPNLQIVNNLYKNIAKLEFENEELRKHSLVNKFNEILNSAFYLSFYTNFNNLGIYNFFITEIIKHGKHFKEDVEGTSCIWSKHKLDPNIQIFLVLARLRLGLLEHDIAFRFEISQTTVSKMFRFWINVMYSYMMQLPIWPSRDLVQKYMPECFRKKFPSTRLILDATELFIQRPSDYIVQSSTYSSYKSHNTAKGLVGITPNGFLCFISELYPGRVSDKEIVVKSGILRKLNPGDSVMADRGFTLENEVKKYDLDLNIPPFAREGIVQFCPDDEQKTRDIANVRIHIERIIGNVKNHRILHQTIPNNMADQLNEIWVVCCHLTNFINVPLLDRKTKG